MCEKLEVELRTVTKPAQTLGGRARSGAPRPAEAGGSDGGGGSPYNELPTVSGLLG